MIIYAVISVKTCTFALGLSRKVSLKRFNYSHFA